MSVEPARHVSHIVDPSLEAPQLSVRLARLALRASAAFLRMSDDSPSLNCSSGDGEEPNAAVLRDMLAATGSPTRHEECTRAWLAVAVRLGEAKGVLCVTAPAPRTFDEHDLATIAAIGALLETFEDGPRLPVQALVDLSGTLLREAQANPALEAGTLCAAADSLDGVATRLREMSAPRRAAADHGASVRILLADDLDLNRRLIADMLSLGGHRVDCVNDGAAAVRAVTAERYDLVLMDMIMPEMDGLAATRAIRALPRPARDVPIVALTANAMRDQLDSCLEAGMDAALTKPMSLDALTDAVAYWTRGRHAA